MQPSRAAEIRSKRCRAYCGQVPCADAGCCTTRQRETHSTDCRELLYVWHPWYGRHVFIHCAVSKAYPPSFHCNLEPGSTLRFMQIPQWMFDVETLCAVRQGESPEVSEALIEIREMVPVFKTRV